MWLWRDREINLHRGDFRALHSRDIDADAFETDGSRERAQPVLGQAEVQQRAKEHVAGNAGRGFDDRDSLVPAGPVDATDSAMDDYWRGRRAKDPDLWVVELTVADGERFVAETIGVD